MGALKALRAANARTIAENPVEAVVHRVLFQGDGSGGWGKDEVDLPPFTGRLVPSRRTMRSFRGRQTEAGLLESSALVLIAPHNADLRAGSDVEDTFTVSGLRYRVTRVMTRAYQGQPYAVHAECEEVS